eukprot:snap_masked-scaffold_14-processed-gene-10.40-mRNA-1 protein AED:1.00 eAED:1.00 QI:0/-1/0/0/-1/1/1/0/708
MKTNTLIPCVFFLSARYNFAAAEKVWTMERGREMVSDAFDIFIPNARLRNLDNKYLLQHDIHSLFANTHRSLSAGSEYAELAFELPDERHEVFETSCKVTQGVNSVSPGLAEKSPTLIAMSGVCESSATSGANFVTIIADENDASSLSVSFDLNGVHEPVYVDHVGSNNVTETNYIMYRSSEIDPLESDFEVFKDVVLEMPKSESPILDQVPEVKKLRSLQETFPVEKYDIALFVTRGYSDFHGGTRESVLAVLATLVARSNSLFLRELAIYFQLIPNQALGICLSSESVSTCNVGEEPNNHHEANDSRLRAVGIADSDYDLGHALCTGGGGIAYLNVLCTDGWKARGATGINAPYTDGFAIDIFAHEVGHQLNQHHSFRDCNGGASDMSTESGSGTTIMSYAGICGNRNTHNTRYHMYSGRGLDRARTLIRSTSCGEEIFVEDGRSFAMSVAPSGTCKVPLGNSFALGLHGRTEGAKYSWERDDVGYEDILDLSLGAVVTWMPLDFPVRYFPNWHYLNYPETRRYMKESLPESVRTWSWRVTRRNLYLPNSLNYVQDVSDLSAVGQLHQLVTTTEFVSAIPIEVVSVSSSTITPNSDVTVTFNIDPSLTSLAQILVAHMYLEPASGDYAQWEEINFEPEWTLVSNVGIVSGQSSYSTTIQIPALSSSQSLPINIMVRGSSVSSDPDDADLCYFFDLATDLTLSPGNN